MNVGNNAAFTSFEATVIAVYNRGVLDKELLSDLMRPYELKRQDELTRRIQGRRAKAGKKDHEKKVLQMKRDSAA
jgi:hypothetical protein